MRLSVALLMLGYPVTTASAANISYGDFVALHPEERRLIELENLEEIGFLAEHRYMERTCNFSLLLRNVESGRASPMALGGSSLAYDDRGRCNFVLMKAIALDFTYKIRVLGCEQSATIANCRATITQFCGPAGGKLEDMPYIMETDFVSCLGAVGGELLYEYPIDVQLVLDEAGHLWDVGDLRIASMVIRPLEVNQ